MTRWAWLLCFALVFPATVTYSTDNYPPADEAEAVKARQEAAEDAHLREKLALRLLETGISRELVVMMIATLPIVELRGAIPIGINLFGMRDQWVFVYLLAVTGNMLPVPFILLLLGPVSKWLMRYRYGRIFFEWLFARTRRKSVSVEKYETLGLTLFVAIPLPVTGGWTGSVAAFLMGVSFRHAFLAILLGVLIAGVIVMTLSLLGWIGAIIAFLVLGAMAVAALMQLFKREQQPSLESNQ